jgi:diamine N-acetyltransferase
MSAILKGNNIYLRLLQASDFYKVLAWENDPDNWRVSNTSEPFSREVILEFVSTPQDIYATGQLRLIICRNDDHEAVGAVDLFGFDGQKQSAGVGILIEPGFRNKGYALEALFLLGEYGLKVVGIRTLFATIHDDNTASIRLFEKAGFLRTGVKESSSGHSGKWLNEVCFQKELIK